MDNLIADVVGGDAFSIVTLTAAINEQPYVPSFLGDLGLFSEEGVSTTTVAVEKKGQALSLVQSSPRGAPGTPIQGDKASLVDFRAPRLAVTAQLTADEVQNVRAFGGNQLAGIEQKRDEKILKMSRSLDLTLEYHRMGAIQGLVLDADGSTLFDLYDKFGISARAEVDLNLDAAYDANDPTKSGAIRKAVTSILRDIDTDLGGDVATGYMCLCSDTGWDALTNAPEVRQTYLNQAQAAELREKDGREAFKFGKCTFVNYRGAGSVKIPDDKFRFLPLGVPELFITRFVPADYMEAVNTNGLPKYVKAVPDPSGYNRFIEMEAQSNPVVLCTRPRVLRKAKIT